MSEERPRIHKALQDTFDDLAPGTLVTGWVLTVEVVDPDSRHVLKHRAGDVSGSLAPWDKLGYLHAALIEAEDHLKAATGDADDDPPSSD